MVCIRGNLKHFMISPSVFKDQILDKRMYSQK